MRRQVQTPPKRTRSASATKAPSVATHHEWARRDPGGDCPLHAWRVVPGAYLPFPTDLPQVGEEVDLDGVPARAAISLRGRRTVPGDLTVHLLLRWQRRAALKQVRYPLRLELGYRHDRPDRLDEPDEAQPRQPGRDDAPVQRDVVAAGADRGLIEKREADLIAGAVDHHVDRLRAAVGEMDAAPIKPVDAGLDHDVAVI